jgi:hypothetical protein
LCLYRFSGIALGEPRLPEHPLLGWQLRQLARELVGVDVVVIWLVVDFFEKVQKLDVGWNASKIFASISFSLAFLILS